VTARVAFAGRARAGAIAVAWIVVFALVGGGASWSLEQVRLHPDPSWWLAWGALTTAAGFGLATWLVGRVLARRSWEELGWRPRTGVPQGLALGVALGAVMAALAVGLAVAAGHAVVTTQPGAASWGAAALPLGTGFLLAAFTEELMFRGYPLRRLAHALGQAPATAFAALCFGLAHLSNPNATAFSTANVALAGVWLSCAFFSPGAMPLAWGAHFGWNATLALGFAAPVSGYAFPVPPLAYHPGTHRWIDGGAFGPEGGIVTTLVMLGGAAALVAWSRRAPPRLVPVT
jgi:membrane protease YdiL (CAAX protease family)